MARPQLTARRARTLAHPHANTLANAKRLTGAIRDELQGARFFVSDTTVVPTPEPTAPHLDTALAANRWVLQPEGMPILWGNRAMLSAGTATPSSSLHLFQNMGATGAGAQWEVAPHVRVGAEGLFAKSFAGFAPSLGFGDNHQRIGLGAALLGIGDHSLEILGPAAKPEHVWVRWTQQRSPGLSLDPHGFLMPWGMGAKYVDVRGKRVQYTACIPLTQARSIVEAFPLHPQGLGALASRLGVAVGLKPTPLQVPSVRDPLGKDGGTPLGLGESLSYRTTDNITVAAAPSVVAARAVAGGNRIREFEVTVQRLATHRIVVTATPQRTVGWSAGADVMLLAEAYTTHAVANATRQEFVFDLSQPEAQAAYQRLVDGEPPEANGPMPAGVEAVAIEKAQIPSHRRGVGLSRWPIIPAKTRIAGLGNHTGTFSSEHSEDDFTRTHTYRTVGYDQQSQRLGHGTRKLRVECTSAGEGERHGPTQFTGLTLRTTVSVDKAAAASKRWLHAQYNALTQHDTPANDAITDADSYRLVVQQTWTDAQLVDLAQTSAQHPALADLHTSLQQAMTGWERAAVVQDHVKAHGLKVLGAITRAGAEPELEVSSSAWETPLRQFDETLWLQDQPPAPGSKAQTQLTQLTLRLQKARDVLHNDPLLQTHAAPLHAAWLHDLDAAVQVCQSLTAPTHPPPDRDD